MTTNGQISKGLFLAGRMIAGGMYLGAGIENLILLDAKAGYTASKGVANPTFWVTVASLLLVVGGISLITGIRPYLGVGALALFLIPVTLIMHNFWAMSGMQATIEFHAFLGNVGLFGSTLLFLAIPQPWAASLDELAISRTAMFRGLSERTATRQDTVPQAHVAEKLIVSSK